MLAFALIFTLDMRLTFDPSLFWAGALVAALAWAVLSAKRSALDERTVYWAGVIGLLFGIWGGHLLGILYYGTDGRPFAWLRIWSGGMAQYGGLIAGALAVTLFLKARHIPFFAYSDTLIPSVALGVAIGRIGCFFNGDDFGTRSTLPWAVRFPSGTEAYADHFNRGWIGPGDTFSLPVHPVQLYATIFWLALFFALVYWKSPLPGEKLAIFTIGHGFGRCVEQFFRGDFQPILGPFSLTQLISAALVLTGISLLVFVRARNRVCNSTEIGLGSERSQSCLVL